MVTNHFRPLHRIFVLDANLAALLDESDPRAFCASYFGKLLEAIGMKRLAPMSVSPAADLAAPGFSGLQELTTSHTSFHYFWDPHLPGGNPNVHIDLYSCAPFEFTDVLRIAHEHFRFAEWTANFIDRNLDPAKRLSLLLRGTGDAILEQLVLTTGKREVAVPVLA